MGAGWDSQTLLEPIAADAPCGENLEDTPLLNSFDSFRLFGQRTPPDPPPDWGAVKSRSLEALARSKDLRLLAHLGAAVLRTDGIAAFAETLVIASQWLERYWTQTYPQVTEDPILRRSALNNFADQMAVIDSLRRTPLVSSRQHGAFTLRDLELASGQLQPRDGEARPEESLVAAAFTEMPLEELTPLHASVAAGHAALRSVDARMRESAGTEAAPGFDNLAAQLQKIERVLAGHVAARQGTAPPAAEHQVQQAPAAGVPLGAIKSRQDAIRALDAVADYFRQTEPSSPVPMFVARAKRLVAKDFMEVLSDIAPDAVAQARAAGGIRDGE